MTYDVKGQVIREQVQTENLVTTEDYTYDGRGRILTQTSSTGQSVSYTWVMAVLSVRAPVRTFKLPPLVVTVPVLVLAASPLDVIGRPLSVVVTLSLIHI